MGVELISKKAFTPKLCLNETMELSDEIEYVCIGVRYLDGTFQTTFSHMPISQACALVKCLDRRLSDLLEFSTGR